MTFIKVCGLRNAESVDAALGRGVDAIGFVFADSVRHIDADDAAPLIQRIIDSGKATEPIGVFKGNPTEEILDIAKRTGLRTVQVHDLTGPEHVQQLRDAGLTVIRAIVAGDTTGTFGADRLLVDGTVAGSGDTWDWSSITAPTGEWILAGGLDLHNVADALAATGAAGVDVSSGVESTRGVKDSALIEQFIDAVRAVGR
ncbi:MAG: phosphoribosylanthranilate isomerase [Rhodococcus sp.]|nr:phosphoribosylanthranilate isomerase [Rhodococcus sp. (in: high G+C Gram-positive bacteria)]